VFSEIKGLAVVVALLLTVFPVYAEVVPEVTFSGGYTDNLFNDSSSLDDTYAAVSPLFKIYPSAEAEITLAGTYTTYYDYKDLSNLYGSAGITIIPNLDESLLSLMFSAGIGGRDYGDLFEAYNNWGANLGGMLSYRMSPRVILRAGMSISTTDYTNSVSGDNEGFGFFGGLNLTPYGSNSLNLEAGFDFERYVTGLDTVSIGGGRRPSSSVSGVKSSFQTVNYSIRFSRPLSKRVGINTYLAGSSFIKEVDSLIYGFTINYLSPWYSLWEGWTWGTNVKAYPGGDFIVEGGFSYSDKSYIENLEIQIVGDSVISFTQNRDDERASLYVNVKRPFKAGPKLLIRPSVQVRWVDNSSDVALFDYAYLDFSAGVVFKF